jgi:hypothetical protein
VAPRFGPPGDDAGRRARLEATTRTVLAAWCASLVATAAFSKAVADPPLPGLRGVAGAAHMTMLVAVEASAALVLAGGLVTWGVLTWRAVRAGRREVVVPALAPGLIVAAWLGVTMLVSLYARHVSHHGSASLAWPGGAVVLGILVTYVAITLAAAAACALAAGVALHRAGVRVEVLARTTGVAALAVAGVAVETVAASLCLVRLFAPAGGLDPRDAVFATGSVAVLVAVTIMGAVSLARGLSAPARRRARARRGRNVRSGR